MSRWILLVVLMLRVGFAMSAVESVQFSSPEYEARYNAMIAELRCLVCQNQNIAGSNAALAMDLRRQVHEMIERGDSDDTIKEFMVTRYGDFVLYRPQMKGRTLLLWIAPAVLLLGGLGIAFFIIRGRKKATQADFSEAEQKRIRDLLDNSE